MKIVIDDKIPFIKGVLEPYAEVIYEAGSQINSELVRDADALIVRTRTKCNAALLNGSSVKFIATATIGHDHIDTNYCKQNGITWTNAPGCNSGSVMQYIGSVLAVLDQRHGMKLKDLTIGIVGVGNVGSKVETLCRNLGMNVLLCDPPRQKKEGGDFVDYKTLLFGSDIISYHVPLKLRGKYNTIHMFNSDTHRLTSRKPVIINSSRGEVVETAALKEALLKKQIRYAVLDVWENEPEIDLELLKDVLIGTPHIAGYSADGKSNGTAMSVMALSRFFNLNLKDWYPSSVPGMANQVLEGDKDPLELILDTYDVEVDSDKLKYDPGKFEYYRGHYPVRREFGYYHIPANTTHPQQVDTLVNMGFKLQPDTDES